MNKNLSQEDLTINDIINKNDLAIYEELTKEQANKITTFLEKRKIKGTLSFYNISNGELIKQIIDKFENLASSNPKEEKIIIKIKDRDSFNYNSFNDKKQNSKITVITETDEDTDMNVFIKTENELRKIIKPIKAHINELTPLEKYLYLHNIVSTFRKFKKETKKEDYRSSRYLNKILFNDYMVCVGFSYLFKDLSKRLNLNSWEIPACSNNKNREFNEYNHFANLISINDSEYNIKGIYLSDTTFDNHTDKNTFLFNHFLQTPNTMKNRIKDMYYAGYSLLSINDKDEFLKILKKDTQSLYSLITIIENYYPNHELFQVNFENVVSYYYYCLNNAEEFYNLAQTITIKKIEKEKLEKALIRLEKVINPNIKENEILEKITKTINLHEEINNNIYIKEENYQKKLS